MSVTHGLHGPIAWRNRASGIGKVRSRNVKTISRAAMIRIACLKVLNKSFNRREIAALVLMFQLVIRRAHQGKHANTPKQSEH